MKRFLFLLSFLMVGALTTVNAQSESKPACTKGKSATACCAKKSTATAATDTKGSCTKAEKASTASASTLTVAEPVEKSVASAVMTASQAAAMDERIEERTCEKSGKVSYYQRAECPVTGKVSYEEVQYNGEEGKFVNMAPSDMEKKACTQTSKTAKVVKTSVKE